VNLQTERDRVDDLRQYRVFSLPVVAVGDSVLGSPQLHEIDAALGFDSEADALLPGPVLVERVRALLAAGIRYANQLPRVRYDDPTPGAEETGPLVLPDGTEVVLPDGRPYMPHATSIGLVCHIVGHGAKIVMLVEKPDSALFVDVARLGPYGEPDDRLPLEKIVAEAERAREGLRGARPELDRVIETYMGQVTVHGLLQVMTYSVAQHTRQLENIVLGLGIDPDGPLGDELEGLGLPAAVWA
jgi:hypothetical protein